MANCVRKVQRTQNDAERYAVELRTRGDEHSNIKAYKCRECGKWHVGHRNNPVEAKEALNRLEQS